MTARIRHLAGVAALAVVVSACGTTGQSASPTGTESTPAGPVSGGQLVVALATEPDCLDPHVTPAAVSYRVVRHIFDSLVVQSDDGFEFEPWLATSWEVNADATEYTFMLREDVAFHDGTPLTAEVVKYNFDRIAAPETQSRLAASLLGPYDSTEIVDDYTVRVHFTRPHAAFLEAASQAFLGMVSPNAVSEGGNMCQDPVGSGPFIFEDWAAGSSIELSRNPDYEWAPSTAGHEGPAFLDALSWRIIPEAAVRIGTLDSGEVDVIEEVPPEDVARLEDDESKVVISAGSPGAPYTIVLNQLREPWDDVRARRAFRAALDIDRIVETLYFGVYDRAWGPITPATPGYSEAVEESWSYDPDLANELLDELGWTGRTADGFRSKDGVPLTARWIIPDVNREKRTDITLLVQEQLREVGIDLQFEQAAASTLFSVIQSGEYDVGATSLVQGDPDVLRVMYHSATQPSPQAFGFNQGHVSDPEIDALFEEALATADPAGRAEIYAEGQDRIVENVYGIPVYVYPYILGASAEVEGIGFDARAYPLFLDAWLSG